jgi:hypothetical protein
MAHEGDVFVDAEKFHLRASYLAAMLVLLPGFQIWPMASDSSRRRRP